MLKPGGVLRVSTPNLSFLVDLYTAQKSELQQTYIKWSTDEFGYGLGEYDDVYVINNFVRDWGHQFIFDEKSLRTLLERAGFDDIHPVELNDSSHPELTGLENHDRMPAGCLEMESMLFEATRPA